MLGQAVVVASSAGAGRRPILAVVVVFAAVAAIMLWRLSLRSSVRTAERVTGWVAVVYGTLALSAVLLPLPPHRAVEVPWWDYINWVPLLGAEAGDFGQNVVLFLPLGVLTSLLGARSVARAVAVGFAASCGIEMTQLALDLTVTTGHATDVNDLLANTVGALLGGLIVRLCLAFPVGRSVVERFAWRRPARDPVDPTKGNSAGHCVRTQAFDNVSGTAVNNDLEEKT